MYVCVQYVCLLGRHAQSHIQTLYAGDHVQIWLAFPGSSPREMSFESAVDTNRATIRERKRVGGMGSGGEGESVTNESQGYS